MQTCFCVNYEYVPSNQSFLKKNNLLDSQMLGVSELRFKLLDHLRSKFTTNAPLD